MKLEPVSVAATQMVKNHLKSAHSNFVVGQGLYQMSAESILIFPNLPFGVLFLSISSFLILSSCILIRTLMNHRLLWACIHQLTLINKTHRVLSTGFPGSGLLLLPNPGWRPGTGSGPNRAGCLRSGWGSGGQGWGL